MIKQNGRIRVARAVENIYTLLTNVKQPMQMQINVEISVEFFCTTLLARRLVPLSAQGRNTNVRRQVFWLSGSLPRIWSRICTQSPKIQQEIDSGKLINFSLLNTTSRIFSIKGGGWVLGSGYPTQCC